MYARHTQAKITVDGVLNEAAWQEAEPAKDFIQKEPTEGDPASEWTEVRVLYDDQNLYIGVYCHDRTPERIVIVDIRRDFRGLDQDYLAIVLDTFNDQSNGYYLGTTPAGGQRDQQISNEGRFVNLSWDGVWQVESRVHDQGWSAELAIPFKTLRFSSQKEQVWGMQVLRAIRRNDETTYWTRMPRQYPVSRSLPYAGEVRGLQNLEPGRNLRVKPYILGGVERFQSRQTGTEGNFDGGLDVKYGLTSGLTLDLTLNTDFSHVEADTEQVNLTRFPLFFPEKREFFLENAGIFSFGATQRREALLFHSRKIGLVEGDPIPILGGTRMTGRAGRNHIGLMNIQTRSEDSVPATNFTATRFRRDILSGSNIGLIFLNRQSSQPDDFNRAYGADANFLFFQNDLRFSTTLARTVTPGRDGADGLSRVEGEWQSRLVRLLSSYVEVERNFNPEMGFVRRPGRRILRNEVLLRPRLRYETRLGSVIRDVVFSLQSEQTLLSGSATETKFLRPQLQIISQKGSTFQVRHTRNFERLFEPFKISDGIVIPLGDYHFNDLLVSYSSDQSRALSGSLTYNWGDFFDGSKRTLQVSAEIRGNYRLSTSIDYERNKVELPAGAFTTDLVGLRVHYSFSARMFLDAFAQYNSGSRRVSSNLRFRFIHRPLSDIYVVYNEQRDTLLRKSDRSLTVKYTHLLNF